MHKIRIATVIMLVCIQILINVNASFEEEKWWFKGSNAS